MPEKLNVRVNPAGGASSHMNLPLVLKDLIKIIQAKKYPPDIEKGLIALANRQPDNTYEQFIKNIRKHIIKVQNSCAAKREKNKGKTNLEQHEEKLESHGTGEAGDQEISGS